MATTIATIRARIRKDLKDEDSIRWSDDEIDRHIQHSVLDISQAVPLEARDESLVIPTPASREIDISGVVGLIYVEAVEYPVGEYPRRYRDYKVWANTLELLIDTIPTAAESIYLYYGMVHTVDAVASTLPGHLEDLCSVGAGAYAALEWASYAINQVNVGGETTPREYLEWAQKRLDFYHSELKRYGRQSRLKVRQLYADLN
jgi:hypothetical protein